MVVVPQVTAASAPIGFRRSRYVPHYYEIVNDTAGANARSSCAEDGCSIVRIRSGSADVRGIGFSASGAAPSLPEAKSRQASIRNIIYQTFIHAPIPSCRNSLVPPKRFERGSDQDRAE